MAGKIFVNYRRDDERAMAARVRDRLASVFGAGNVFMDVDNLLAGQRFDKELEKALVQTDVFLAVIGPRWMELLTTRQASGERDYVREEIAGALKRGIVVIPVLMERVSLPRADELPDDIYELVLHQKHDVTHERFGRDVDDLVTAIRVGRKGLRREAQGNSRSWLIGASLVAVALFVGLTYLNSRGRNDDSISVETKVPKEPDPKRVARPNRFDQFDPPAPSVPPRATPSPSQNILYKPIDPPRPGEVFIDCIVCPEMVVVPAGEFMMGSNDGQASESPVRKVTISVPFAVGKCEVTFEEWNLCVKHGGCNQYQPSDNGWGRVKRPVINVSWDDAKAYAAWLSNTTGKGYRLLSEAEWEYAARAGSTTKYAFGDTITARQAQFWGGVASTVPVGSFPANRFGLHDMHGNAWEWVEDNWHPNYQGAPQDGLVWQGGDASLRVLRGGSWLGIPVSLRSAYRAKFHSDYRYLDIGFRVARNL